MALSRRWFLAGLAAVALTAPAAEARMHAPYRGHRIISATAAPPLDGFTTPTGAYSFRKLRSAYAGPAVKLQRVDLATQDIGFLGCTGFTGCPIDVAAANAFCTTACGVQTWYDQSGNGRDLIQATAANQPAYVAACNGSLPCLQVTAAAIGMAQTGTLTPATGTMSYSLVGRRTAGTGACVFRATGSNTANAVGATLSGNTWRVIAGTVGLNGAAAENVWHSVQAVANGASSVFSVDGVEATGSTTLSTAAGAIGFGGAATTTCQFDEGLLWDNLVNDAATRTFLTANQRSFWGTP